MLMLYTSGEIVIRTQVYLTEEQRTKLKEQASISRRPVSDLIREALDDFLLRHAEEWRSEVLEAAAGMWAGRNDLQAVYSARATIDRNPKE